MSARDALPTVGASAEEQAIGVALSALREAIDDRRVQLHGASPEYAAILRVDIHERERAIALLAARSCVLGLQRHREAA